ncbi:hypothetical protein SUGI_0634610 [Cryptomeria japonica]|nr:hypothetical protein SUGI_0634610 [Cryptomeria japonica]
MVDLLYSTEFVNHFFSQEEMVESFDLVFVDADKHNTLNYHECLLRLVKIGGLVCFNNSLWCGTIVGLVDEKELEEVRNNTC